MMCQVNSPMISLFTLFAFQMLLSSDTFSPPNYYGDLDVKEIPILDIVFSRWRRTTVYIPRRFVDCSCAAVPCYNGGIYKLLQFSR